MTREDRMALIEAIVLVILFACLVLFRGEPDLLHVIVERVRGC